MRIYKYMRALDSVICPNYGSYCNVVDDAQDISKRLEKMISYSAIFFSNPMVFNDPFDANFSIDTKDKDRLESVFEEVSGNALKEGITTEEKVNELRKNLHNQLPLQNYRVSCFSEDLNNELMWAHYADQHRGVILCYDFEDKKVKYRNDKFVFIDNGSLELYSTTGDKYELLLDRVRYLSEKPKLVINNGVVEEEYNTAVPLYIKSKSWIYEQEIRLAIQSPLGHGFPEGDYYILLDKDCLKSVVFGERLEDKYRKK